MNDNITLEEAQQSMEALHSMEDSATTTTAEEVGGPPSPVSPAATEPPRRTSVVEMWRRRDNQSAATKLVTTGGGSVAPSKTTATKNAIPLPSSSGRHSVVTGQHQQEEKKDEESAAPPPKPSTVRNMWSQRDKLQQQLPSSSVVAIEKRRLTPRPTSVDTTAEATQEEATQAEEQVDLTIVPSPSKSPTTQVVEEYDSAAIGPPPPPSNVQTQRPANVMDFWAQRGLKPIQDNGGTPDGPVYAYADAATASPTSTSASWKNANQQQSPTEKSVGSVPSTGKMSVVDRWKQRVEAPPEATVADAPKSSERKPVSERWTAAVVAKKPVAEPVASSRPAKVADRWINRNQQQQQPEMTPPRSVASTATSSWRSPLSAQDAGDHQEAKNNNVVDSTAVDSDGDTATSPPVIRNQHVTKRWSNRLSSESSGTAAGSPPSASRPKPKPYSSLPAPRMKGDDSLRSQPKPRTMPAASTPPRKHAACNNSSSAPSTPKSVQSQPPPTTTTPDSQRSVDMPTPNSEPRRAPLTKKLRTPEFKPTAFPRSPKPRLPDFNALTGSPKQDSRALSSPSSPLSPPRSAGKMQTLTPRFRYENSAKKNWPAFPVPASPNSKPVAAAHEEEPPRLLVLISGQSLSREHASIRQKATTILNGHKIPFDEMDGSVLSVRDRRNELFKISGLWAQYPQFFIREGEQTIFWGTWETLQQCNDAGKIAEEFAPQRMGGQSASAIPDASSPNPSSLPNKPAQKNKIQKLVGKKPTTVDRIPLSVKSGRFMPDQDDEAKTSMSSPSRGFQKQSAVDQMELRKNVSAIESTTRDKKKYVGRKTNMLKAKIDEDSVTLDESVGLNDVHTVDESVAAHTTADTVTTASTAPRLGAKSLDSLERKDRREKFVPAQHSSSQQIPSDTDMDAILQPGIDYTSFPPKKNHEKPPPVLMSWPPPKKSYHAFSTGKGGAEAHIAGTQSPPPPRAISPQFPAPLRMSPPLAPSRDPQTSSGASDASGSSSRGSSQRDINTPRAKRIGQRLIEKKRELQAHRLRLRKNRSTDSGDVLSTTGIEYDPGADSVASSAGDRNVVLGVDKTQAASVFQQARATHGPIAMPDRSATIDSSPATALSPATRTTTLSNPDGAASQSPCNDAHNPEKGSWQWINKSAFSPVDESSPGGAQPVAHRPEPLASPARGAVPSPKKEVGSPHSDGGFSFLDVKSDADGSNSVTSRGSALSLRAERLLKQRRQKGTLAGVMEADENDEGRKHAQEIARNVVYGNPKQRPHQQSAEKARKWGMLRVQTAGQQGNSSTPKMIDAFHTDEKQPDISGFDDEVENLLPAPQPGPTESSRPAQQRKKNDVALDETETMTRQRAGLSSRYTTSARFMDQNTEPTMSPPPSTKSVPMLAYSSFAPASTKSAPASSGIKSFSGTFSGDSQDTRGSSEDFRSMSSQTSRNDSSYHTSRQSMTGTMNSVSHSHDVRSSHGIHDDFVSESAYSYDALRNAYSTMTFGQLAADFAGEVSNALNLGKIQNDVKKVFGTGKETSTKKVKRGFACADLVPYDEEDVAIEVEYMEDSVYEDETSPSYGFCQAKGCGVPSPSQKGPSFEEPRRGRGRRVGEV